MENLFQMTCQNEFCLTRNVMRTINSNLLNTEASECHTNTQGYDGVIVTFTVALPVLSISHSPD